MDLPPWAAAVGFFLCISIFEALMKRLNDELQKQAMARAT
jgi:hypothetical protein